MRKSIVAINIEAIILNVKYRKWIKNLNADCFKGLDERHLSQQLVEAVEANQFVPLWFQTVGKPFYVGSSSQTARVKINNPDSLKPGGGGGDVFLV